MSASLSGMIYCGMTQKNEAQSKALQDTFNKKTHVAVKGL